ncbi:MAG: lysophospholipase [Rhodobacterales bacterium 17-64-5]|nr:MAG: lysophospholipase [Rhodobacterales bacterium 12-65-15]OZA19180.1 MAG: lysophospholipase [Rhodobacterales bacterium 17-64-5]
MINILKLCVGADSVEDLIGWHESQRAHWPQGQTIHVTRMWPKREVEVLDGGSLYWVIKGVILARQRISDLRQVDLGDGISRCALVLDAKVIRTEAAPRRPFQGWRYLDPADSPRDLPMGRAKDDPLPPALAQALAEIGLR